MRRSRAAAIAPARREPARARATPAVRSDSGSSLQATREPSASTSRFVNATKRASAATPLVRAGSCETSALPTWCAPLRRRSRRWSSPLVRSTTRSCSGTRYGSASARRPGLVHAQIGLARRTAAHRPRAASAAETRSCDGESPAQPVTSAATSRPVARRPQAGARVPSILRAWVPLCAFSSRRLPPRRWLRAQAACPRRPSRAIHACTSSS